MIARVAGIVGLLGAAAATVTDGWPAIVAVAAAIIGLGVWAQFSTWPGDWTEDRRTSDEFDRQRDALRHATRSPR